MPRHERASGTAGVWVPGLLSACFSLVLVSLSRPLPPAAAAYGYSRAEDPLIVGVKAAIQHYRGGRFEEAGESLSSLRWQIDELKGDLRIDLDEELSAAYRSRDLNRFGFALTHLVFQGMRQKFYWNLRESLGQHGAARARLDSALFYYEEILSPSIRRADRSQEADRHRRIMDAFRKLRDALGTPGLFGVGAKSPRVEDFRRESRIIVKQLREVFPTFLSAATGADARESNR